MLVVIVIIWILLFALLPRFRWYLAKTRDIKRHADLRNIALAVQLYKDDRGLFPNPGWNFGRYLPIARNVYHLSPYLKSYLSSIPTDPNKDTIICIHWQCSYYKKHAGTINGFWKKEKTPIIEYQHENMHISFLIKIMLSEKKHFW